MATLASVREVFAAMPSAFRSEKAGTARALILFDMAGEDGGRFWVCVADGACEVGEGEPTRAPDATVHASVTDWLRISNKELNPILAHLQGKVKIRGAVALALKLAVWFPNE